MVASKAQLEAQKRYKEKNNKQYKIDVNKKTEQDIIDILEKQPNKARFIKNAIREKANKEK